MRRGFCCRDHNGNLHCQRDRHPDYLVVVVVASCHHSRHLASLLELRCWDEEMWWWRSSSENLTTRGINTGGISQVFFCFVYDEIGGLIFIKTCVCDAFQRKGSENFISITRSYSHSSQSMIKSSIFW